VLLLLLLGGGILEARLEARVGEEPDVAVRFAYRIEARGIDRLAFSALEIDGVSIEEVAAFAGENPLPLSLEPRSGPKREGSISLPEGTSFFELRYIVRDGVRRTEDGIRVRLPCAILGLPIEETKTGLFSSVVVVPDGLSLVDGFPSHSVSGADGSYRWELPLVPTFVAFRATAKPVLLTPPRVATMAVVVLLLVMGFMGVRKARAASA
jgi:hypothetical protein